MAASLLVLGCARKAPGPELCVPFTEMLMGATHEEILEYPRAKAKFDAVVVTCLTKPFDPRVFTCAAESRAPLECLRRYEPELLSVGRDPSGIILDEPYHNGYR
jgi:hypothetical protein